MKIKSIVSLGVVLAAFASWSSGVGVSSGALFTSAKEGISANKDISQVGVRLVKFASSYDLNKITEQAQSYAEPLNAKYGGKYASQAVSA